MKMQTACFCILLNVTYTLVLGLGEARYISVLLDIETCTPETRYFVSIQECSDT